MKETLSIKIFHTLLSAKNKLGQVALGRISDFVCSQRTNEDTFMDKSGKADLYYTSFGWMLSYVLDIRLDNKKTGNYLAAQDTQSMDLVHYAAYVRCKMIQKLFEGGKIKLLLHSVFAMPVVPLTSLKGFPHNDIQSPYTQYIWLSLLEDSRQPIKDKNKITDALLPYKTTGGYTNIKGGNMATTNATAAALAIAGQLKGYDHCDEVAYLRASQHESGGFAAAENAPVPDLLSTATSLFMLKCYGVKPKYSPVDFIQAHWQESGGFSATIMEDSSDVEYVFYGMLALGSLS